MSSRKYTRKHDDNSESQRHTPTPGGTIYTVTNPGRRPTQATHARSHATTRQTVNADFPIVHCLAVHTLLAYSYPSLEA